MQLFAILFRPTRPDFNDTATDEEMQILGEHFAGLEQMLADGRLILAGPCEDAAFGILIFRAETAGQAQAVLDNDPAVVAGVFTGEVHPYRISLASFDH